MRVLLHVCCGPCAIMPIRRLLEEGHELCGFFFNPNIHPLAEYLRRRAGALQVAEKYNIPLYFSAEEDCKDGYNTAAWLDMHSADDKIDPLKRCPVCWEQRLERVRDFALAGEGGSGSFDAFSSSLLYSRRQRHDEIAALGRRLAQNKLDFLYRDFRADWQEGIKISKEWGIYRQQYCGCIFSENERYAKEL
ncbi:MAG: epoxyqueuosine reductase QueH [Deltaproteobacteria bacterium]|jgi:predicted adenine nucleotide alpha hydrolase (AANH) superfamily ATPase|nr:epoxyqueuosine reductase QueH [Deltaproteobacteria bacterium]